MNKNTKNKKAYVFVMIAAIAVVLLCISYFLFLFSGTKMSNEEKNQYTKSNTSAVTKVDNSGGIDFAKLKKTNSDIIGWIKVDGTGIDYPVLRPQGKSDSYYLNHTYKKEYSSAGAIYAEKKNASDFSDAVTVLYGHNWKNNGYFRPLYNFKDLAFFEKNKYMYVYTEKSKLTYEIYAAYIYDDRHILNSFDFTNTTVLYDYLQTTLNPTSIEKNVRSGVALDQNSKILTLSTCLEGVETSRYLVQGVLIKTDPID